MEKNILELIKARETLIFIETIEEDEVCKLLKNVSLSLNRSLISWDALDNFKDISPSGVPKAMDPLKDVNNLQNMLDAITSYQDDAIFLLRDANYFIHEQTQPQEQASYVRKLKILKSQLKKSKKNIIFIGHEFSFPSELQEDFSIIYHKRPDVETLKEIFIDFLVKNNLNKYFMPQAKNNEKEVIQNEIIQTAKGLTADQFRSALSKSIVKNGEISNKTIADILQVKKQIISKDGILEYIEPEVDMNSVGGLKKLKDWLKKRKKAFLPEAKEIGLPEPKGLMVFGVPGTGKSLVSKATSAYWQRPIIRFDVGRIFGSYVGETEKNMRRALDLAEAVAPCILWIDELEKGFAGAKGGSELTIRVLGHFLTWMQEKEAAVFVIATANDITQLPSELLRKGRFDEIFFVDIPNSEERKEIFKIQLKKYKLKPGNFELNKLSGFYQAFTGAEIEQAIVEAKFNAFYEKREVTLDDLREVRANLSPIYASFEEKLKNQEYKNLINRAKCASPKEED